MKLINRAYFTNSSGAALPEYTFALVLMLGVFLAASQMLKNATDNRVDSGTQIEFNFVPCGTDGLFKCIK